MAYDYCGRFYTKNTLRSEGKTYMDLVKNLSYKVEYITGGSFEQPRGPPHAHPVVSSHYFYYIVSHYYTHMSIASCCAPDEDLNECHYSFFLITKQ